MSELLPPGIPQLQYEDLKDELVSYLHGEKTTYSRDVIAYYIEHNTRLKKAYSEIQDLTKLLQHVPEVEPSKNFHRRIAKALPQLRHTHKVSSNLQTLLTETGWGIEERVLFLWAFIKFRIKQQPSAILSLCGMILFLVTAITILPKILSNNHVLYPEAAFTEVVIPDVIKVNKPSVTKSDTSDEKVLKDFIIETPKDSYKPEVKFNPINFGNANYPPMPEKPKNEVVSAPSISLENSSILIKPKMQVLNWYSTRTTKKNDLSKRERKGIDDALSWLATMQYADGSFRTTAPDKASNKSEITENSEDTRIETDNSVIILTAYAALAFITDGYSSYAPIPKKKASMSKDEYAEFRKTFAEYRVIVRKAISFLKSVQNEEGFMGNYANDGVLAHSLSLLAMVEDRITYNNWRLIAPIRDGVQFLMEYQNYDGGWGTYPADNLSTLHTTVWSVIALKAAAQSDSELFIGKDKVFLKISEFIKNMSDPEGFFPESRGKAYPEGHLRPTSEGLLLQTIMKTADPEILQKTIALLTADDALPKWDFSKRVANNTFIDYDYWFFGYISLNSVKDKLSKKQSKLIDTWNENLLKTILDNQYEYGAWEEVNPHKDWGRVYSTALAVLTLQNKYRYSFD